MVSSLSGMNPFSAGAQYRAMSTSGPSPSNATQTPQFLAAPASQSSATSTSAYFDTPDTSAMMQYMMQTMMGLVMSLVQALVGALGNQDTVPERKDSMKGVKTHKQSGPEKTEQTPDQTTEPDPPAGSNPPAAYTSGEQVPENLKAINQKYGPTIQKALDEKNKQYGSKLTKNYVLAEIMAESGGNASDTTGDDGHSIGLMQLNDALGFSREDRLNPDKAIPLAVDIMAKYNAQYNGDFKKTAGAYMTNDNLDGPYATLASTYGDSIVSMMSGGPQGNVHN